MVNIDVLTLGNELKNDSNEIFKVVSNFSEGKKIFIELELVAPTNEELQELIKY